MLELKGQELSNFRSKQIFISSDTTILDTLSLIPQSEHILGLSLDELEKVKFDYPNAKLIAPHLKGRSIDIKYRVYPLLFTKPYYHKSLKDISLSDPGRYDFFTLKPQNKQNDLFNITGLNKNGSISRGINFGNNQNLSVNSNLDLQLSGKVTEDISIQAAISDNNLPIQPEGNTQQLQEFDRVFIRLFDDNSSLIAGDFLLTRPMGYFMNLNKKVQGGGYSTEVLLNPNAKKEKQGILKVSANAAISRGKFSRNVIPGVEGNQGPYRLQGADGETFIIVLSGTERVYVNGRLMKRGQDNDYVIDYNTAELTFMPQQLISKDQRIVVEFQYSERNYARSLYFVKNEYEQDRLKVNFNIYSEQDNKNRPLQQELSDDEKLLLARIGDQLDSANISGIDTVEFDNDQVLYKLVDTLGYQNVLVYSKNPDSALYRARFSNVGTNNGNYRQIRSDGNGRVFQWVQPVNGQPQGDHEPIIRLVTPKQRQMLNLGAEYQLTEGTNLKIEGAYTKNDVNTFSDRDSRDDHSYGLRLDLKSSETIGWKDSASALKWNNRLFYEQIGRNFQFIERYRNVEFQRDWNIQDLQFEGNEYITMLKTGLGKGRNFFNYEFSSFIKGSDYEGFKNGYSTNYENNGFQIESKGSYLTAESVNNSEFLRHYSTISQKFWGIKAGAYLEQERILFYQGKTDSIQGQSFDRIIWKAFIEKGDSTSENSYQLSYSEIYDYLPNADELNYSLKSENFGLDFKMASNRRSRLSGKVIYRELSIINKELTTRNPENTLLGRLDYDLKAWSGFLSSNTFYQIGSGLENRREFSFLQVSDGQGTHVWNDYNENNIKELNEFEVAGVNNQFQANYIKVFTPTNDFIRVFSNQFNQTLFLKPAAILKTDKKWKKLLSRFSNRSAFRTERKTSLENDIYSPFQLNVEDSSLITLNSSFANTVYFNRLNPKFGLDFYYLDNRKKSLLVNGIESRGNTINEVKVRYNLTKIYSVESRFTLSRKSNRSEFFESRNYTVESKELSPSFIYQPNVKFRLRLSTSYSERNNLIGEHETSINQSNDLELNYNQAGKGALTLAVSYIRINFSGDQNSTLAFEMLDGLQDGNNATWNFTWQRNLSNSLQLNVSYGGRKSEGIRTIHTGGMQVRAFF